MSISLKNVVLLSCALILLLNKSVFAKEGGEVFSSPSTLPTETIEHKKSTIKKLMFESRDWLSPDAKDMKVHVTVNLMSPRLMGVSYLFDDEPEVNRDNQDVSGFMYCVNRYLVVESGYPYAAIGVEKIITEKNRVNFFLAMLNEGETPVKVGTYVGLPWFDKVLLEEFKWDDFIFLNQVSEDTCAKIMKPDYSFRLVSAAV